MPDSIESAQKTERRGVTIVTVGFMIFSVFFGAGNLIFPPFLGFMGGSSWWQGFIAFILTDTILAILGLAAAAKIPQVPLGIFYRPGRTFMNVIGTIAMISGTAVIVIPRTAATAFEIFLKPVFMPNVAAGTSTVAPSLIFCAIFIIGACACAIRPTKVVDIIGKFLTPALLLSLVVLIIVGVVNGGAIRDTVLPMGYATLFQAGIIEGYQTTDMATGTIIGIIVLSALMAKGIKKSSEQSKTILRSGVVAGICLVVIYLGLTILGLLVSTNKELITLFEASGRIDRTYLLNYIISSSIGRGGTILMGIVVLLATFTTCIGSGSMLSQFFVRLTKGKWQYKYICMAGFGFGIFMTILSFIGGGSGVTFLLKIAMPLMIILMPIMCALIFLNLFSSKLRNDNIYRAGVIVAGLAGACDYFGSGMFGLSVPGFKQAAGLLYGKWNIFAGYGFSWIIPTIVACLIGALITYKGFENRPFLRENEGQEAEPNA